jgi:Ig-like domain-containing protein
MHKTMILLLALATVATACQPAPTPKPSATPSPSLMPTLGPTELPTLTPAPILLTPTFEAAAADILSCRVISQAMRNGRHLGYRERFDMGWKVKNTGNVVWDPASVDFVFSGGSRMYQSATAKLQKSVDPGNNVILVADLLTPKAHGHYTTFWSLRRGTEYFCRVSLTIFVP